MCDLMEKVGLSNRVIRSYEDLNLQEITKEIDYAQVEEKLNLERKKAEEYIRNVLS